MSVRLLVTGTLSEAVADEKSTTVSFSMGNMAKQSVSPPWSATALERVARTLGDGLTGTEIGIVLSDSTIGDVDGPGQTKWKRIYNALVTRQYKDRSGNCVIRFIAETMKPIRFVQNPARRSGLQAEMNEILVLEGLKVNDEGKVVRLKKGKASTLGEAAQRAGAIHTELRRRNAHSEVFRYCSTEVLQKNNFHAMLEASKSVPDRLRKMTGRTADGAELIQETLLPKRSPHVAINDGADPTDHSEQAGFASLVTGLLGMYRNTTAHPARINRQVTDDELLEALTTLSMVHRRLDEATIEPTT